MLQSAAALTVQKKKEKTTPFGVSLMRSQVSRLCEFMQRVSSEAKAADLHSSDLQAELRHQQEGAEEKDAEIRRLQKVYTVQIHMLNGTVTDCTVPT